MESRIDESISAAKRESDQCRDGDVSPEEAEVPKNPIPSAPQIGKERVRSMPTKCSKTGTQEHARTERKPSENQIQEQAIDTPTRKVTKQATPARSSFWNLRGKKTPSTPKQRSGNQKHAGMKNAASLRRPVREEIIVEVGKDIVSE